MRKLLENYTITLVSLLVTFVLSIIASFGLHLSDTDQFIVLSVGVMASVVVATIEREIPVAFKSLLDDRLQELTRGFELYRLLTNIDDESLQGEVVSLARSLSSGEVPANLAEARARALIKRVRTSLYAVDYPTTKQSMLNWWNSGTGRTWYESNIAAKKERGVFIERHFILKKAEVIENNGDWDSEVLALLKKHADAGIDVHVMWVEEVTQHEKRPTRNILQDLVVFDEEEASASNSYETKIYRRPSDKVHYYTEVFKEQRQYSYKLQEILPSPQSSSVPSK